MPLGPDWQPVWQRLAAGGLPTDPLWLSSPEYLRASTHVAATQSPRPLCRRARPRSFHGLSLAGFLCRRPPRLFCRLPQMSICRRFCLTVSQNRPPDVRGIRFKLQPLDVPGLSAMRCHAMRPPDQESGSGCFGRSHDGQRRK